ncbi:MAG: glycosyltransferase family 87 protein [Pseudomonadota bacterium]
MIRQLPVFRIGYLLYSLAAALLIGDYLLSVDGLRDFTGSEMVGRDFINFWTGGREALAGQVAELYDRAQYRETLLASFGPPLSSYNFSYPPHSTTLLAPFGALPYLVGLVLWSLGGVVALAVALRPVLRSPWDVFLVCSAPAVLVALILGQTGLWVAALLIAGLHQLRERPAVSGVLIGLLTVKPQLGVLVLAVLVLGRHWTAILWATLTTLLFVGLSVLLHGIAPWQAYLADTMPFQMDIISRSIGLFDDMVQSPFKWLINLGQPVGVARAVQGVFALVALLLTIRAVRISEDPIWVVTHVALLTFLFSPYITIYDMPALLYPALVLLALARTAPSDQRLRPALASVTLIALPVLGFYASFLDVPLTPLVITLCIVLIGRVGPDGIRGAVTTNIRA